jgi:hypothetical protein
MTPGKELTEEVESLMKEMTSRPFELVEQMSKKEQLEKFNDDFWGSINENYTRSMEISQDLFQKSMRLFNGLWNPDLAKKQQEKFSRVNESYQNLVKSYMEAATANTKIIQEYFTSDN